MTHDLLIGGVARLQIGLRCGQGRQSFGAAGLGLGHVGARHLAHIETVLGRLELLGEHRHVVLAQTHDSRVAHDIDIGGYGVEQHGLLNAAPALARSPDRRPCPPDGVQILKALHKRLSECTEKPRGLVTPEEPMPAALALAPLAEELCPPADLLISISLFWFWKLVSASPLIKGRKPALARATCSSVALSRV